MARMTLASQRYQRSSKISTPLSRQGYFCLYKTVEVMHHFEWNVGRPRATWGWRNLKRPLLYGNRRLSSPSFAGTSCVLWRLFAFISLISSFWLCHLLSTYLSVVVRTSALESNCVNALQLFAAVSCDDSLRVVAYQFICSKRPMYLIIFNLDSQGQQHLLDFCFWRSLGACTTKFCAAFPLQSFATFPYIVSFPLWKHLTISNTN